MELFHPRIYLTGDACYFVEGTWGPEWNPSGLQAPPGGDLWYTFVPPVAGTVTVTDPYSATLSEYLNAFSSYANLLARHLRPEIGIPPAFPPMEARNTGWKMESMGRELPASSCSWRTRPKNDNFANATPIIFATNAIVSTLVDGQVTNYTLTGQSCGAKLSATVDAGEQSIGNLHGGVYSGPLCLVEFYAVHQRLDFHRSYIIHIHYRVGIKPTSAGAGANYNVCGGKTANNNCITNYQITPAHPIPSVLMDRVWIQSGWAE